MTTLNVVPEVGPHLVLHSVLGVPEGRLEKRLARLVRLVLALGEQHRDVELLRHRVGEPRVALEDGRLRGSKFVFISSVDDDDCGHCGVKNEMLLGK